jgi:hypothetical protein
MKILSIFIQRIKCLGNELIDDGSCGFNKVWYLIGGHDFDSILSF